MLFGWLSTTTVVVRRSRNGTGRGFSAAARQTANAVNSSRSSASDSRTAVVRCSGPRSATESAMGIVSRLGTATGMRRAQSGAVTIRPPCQLAADVVRQRVGAFRFRGRRRPRELRRRPGEARLTAGSQLRSQQLERLALLDRLAAGTFDGDERALDVRERRGGPGPRPPRAAGAPRTAP